MKIINYKKIKNNLYEITLEDQEKIKLYDEIILKSGLLLKKEIDSKTLNKLISDNSYYELYNKVVKYISNKMRTEKEIYNKFKDYSRKDITNVINKLKEQNYLNEDDYIKAYINDSINLKMVGLHKIKNELIKLGMDEEKVIARLNEIDTEIWESKIEKLALNMINHNHKYSLSMLKNKIVTNLINKGFDKEQILNFIDNCDIEVDNSIYEKEYQKLKGKLSKKYSDNEFSC